MEEEEGANGVVHSPETPEWRKVTQQHHYKEREGGERGGRQREKRYFTPMQHAEEIQLPLDLHY